MSTILIAVGIGLIALFIFATLCILKAASKADEYSEKIAIQREIATTTKLNSNK